MLSAEIEKQKLMMTPLFTALLVTVVAACLKAYFDIQVKFAKSREEAVEIYKSAIWKSVKLIVNLAFFAGIAFLGYWFVSKARSDKPLSNGDVALMAFIPAFFSGYIVLVLFGNIANRIVNLLERMTNLIKQQQENFSHHLEITDSVVDGIEQMQKDTRVKKRLTPSKGRSN